jgi:pSer/pThr/pTyr-binding forkhead associated (FHA) protein
MMWIETLTRSHDVISRVRIEGASARVGRAYDNDVVLDDPYVAAHHLRISRADDGSLAADDLGSRNGLFDASGRRAARIALDGDRIVRIGRTLLRVRDEHHAVAPERPSFEPGGRARLAAGLSLALFALLTFELWLGETTEPRVSRYVFPQLAFAAIILVWTTGWALVSRLFSDSARFATHLAIALAGMLVYDVFDTLAEIATYALSLEAIARYRYVVGWIFVALLAFFHLRAIGARHLAVKGGIVAVLVATAVGAQTLVQAEAKRARGEPPYLSRLLPPSLRLRAPDSVAEFLSSSDTLKAGLDRARDEEPPEDGMLPFGSDP